MAALLQSQNNSTIEIVQEILKSRKNSNLILRLEERLLTGDENAVLSSIEAIQEVFIHFYENKDLCIGQTTTELNAEEKYKLWLKDRLKDFRSHFLALMLHENQEIQETALEALMKLIESEGRNVSEKNQSKFPVFPKESFTGVVCSLVANDVSMLPMINHFEQYLVYGDVKIFTLKAIVGILSSSTDQQKTTVFLQNVFALLSKIHFPKEFGTENENSETSNSFINASCANPFILNKKPFAKVFSQAWIQFLKFKLPPAVYKKVLIYLPKKVLPHMNDPLLLTDFLTDSYNVGGVASLLALNGIFYLMQKFNLEYPEFFNKLYAMFTQEILTSKFRARFFFLSDLFLSSTHLPGYLVAAFVKRLARLTLCSPPNVILIILTFIRNLLIRHPSLRILIHNPDKGVVLKDPYEMEEPDPAKSHALESSLWEIKSLQNHWNPDISKKSKFINFEFGQVECDFGDQLEVTLMDMEDTELSKNYEDIPTSYDKPDGLFRRKEDTMHTMWIL